MGNMRSFRRRLYDNAGDFSRANPYRGFWRALKNERRRVQQGREAHRQDVRLRDVSGSNSWNG